MGIVVLGVLGYFFVETARDTRAEPYEVPRGRLQGWTLTLEKPGAPTDPVVSLRPPSELAGALFRQLYRRGMDERVLRHLDPDREIAIGWAMLHGFVTLAQSDRMPPFGLCVSSLPELREALLEERLRAIRA